MADILSLAQYKTMAGITNIKNDAKITALLPSLNMAITQYTERDFTTATVTESRTYQYDDSGYLDIDDASTITGVTVNPPYGAGVVLSADEWLAQPALRDDAPVYWYIVLPGLSYGIDPEMGFKWNADTLYREGRYRVKPATVTVAGTWGWPVVPADVQLAAKWTLDDWIARRPETAAPAEAIESYSRNFGNDRFGEGLSLAIPFRARDLLAPYTKVRV